MTRIQVLSDIHLEFADYQWHDSGVDYVVLAGDIGPGLMGIEWALQQIREIPVIYVLGNHEYYDNAYPRLVQQAKGKTKGTNVCVLEKGCIAFDDVVFVGATLWTDFNAFGKAQEAKTACAEQMNDYACIRHNLRKAPLRPDDTQRIHRATRKWLGQTLLDLKGDERRQVVVTHHAPSLLSKRLHAYEPELEAAYISNMDAFMAAFPIDLWIHGHIHEFKDYQHLGTRVVCNPRGYPHQEGVGFDGDWSVEI